MSPSAREDFLHNMAYAICRWKYLMLATFIAMFAMVFFVTYLISPTWEVKTNLLAVPSVPASRGGTFADPTRPPAEAESKLYGEHAMRILKGKEMAVAVVKEFGLDERLRKKIEEPSTPREKFFAATLGNLAAAIGALQEWLSGKPAAPPDWVDKAALDFNEGLFSWVSAEVAEGTDVVELTINGQTPELANRISVFMIEALRKQLAGISTGAGIAAVDAFRKELEKVTELQAEADRAVCAFVAANNGAAPSAMVAQKTGDLTKLQDERNRLLAEKAELDRYQDAARAGDATAPLTPAASDRILGSVVIQQLQQKLHDSRARLATLRAEVTDEHPDVIGLLTQIRQTEAELGAEVEGVIRSVDAEIRSRGGAVEALQVELAELQDKVFAHSQLALRADAYRQLRQQLEEHVNVLGATVNAGVAAMNIQVLDHAPVSAVASSDVPSWFIAALVAFFFAAGCAVMLPPCIEYWRNPIRGPVDLAEHGLVPLAVIPDLGRKWSEQNDRAEGRTT